MGKNTYHTDAIDMQDPDVIRVAEEMDKVISMCQVEKITIQKALVGTAMVLAALANAIGVPGDALGRVLQQMRENMLNQAGASPELRTKHLGQDYTPESN